MIAGADQLTSAEELLPGIEALGNLRRAVRVEISLAVLVAETAVGQVGHVHVIDHGHPPLSEAPPPVLHPVLVVVAQRGFQRAPIETQLGVGVDHAGGVAGAVGVELDDMAVGVVVGGPECSHALGIELDDGLPSLVRHHAVAVGQAECPIGGEHLSQTVDIPVVHHHAVAGDQIADLLQGLQPGDALR